MSKAVDEAVVDATARGARLKDHAREVSALMETSLATALNGLASAVTEEAWSQLEGGLKSAFETMARSTSDVLERLSEAEGRAMRTARKEQQSIAQIKLEQQRVATKKLLENQKQEIDAKHVMETEKRRQALSDGGYSALADAERMLEACENELAKSKRKLSGSEEALAVAQNSIRESEARAKKAEEALEVQSKGLEMISAHVSDEILDACGITATKHKSLADRIGMVMEMVDVHSKQLTEVKETLSSELDLAGFAPQVPVGMDARGLPYDIRNGVRIIHESLESTREELAAASAERDTLKVAHDGLNQERARLEGVLSETSTELAALRGEHAALRGEHADAAEKIDMLQQALDKMAEQMGVLREEHAATQAELVSASMRIEAMLDMEERFQGLEVELTAMKNERDEYRSKLVATETQLDKIDKDMRAMLRAVACLSTGVAKAIADCDGGKGPLGLLVPSSKSAFDEYLKGAEDLEPSGGGAAVHGEEVVDSGQHMLMAPHHCQQRAGRARPKVTKESLALKYWENEAKALAIEVERLKQHTTRLTEEAKDEAKRLTQEAAKETESLKVEAMKQNQKLKQEAVVEAHRAYQETERLAKEYLTDMERMRQRFKEEMKAAVLARDLHWSAETDSRVAPLDREVKRLQVLMEDEKRACRSALQHISVSSGGYRGVATMPTGSHPLAEQLGKLQDAYLAMEYALERSHKELDTTAQHMQELRAKLDDVQLQSRTRIRESQEAAHRERSTLVNAAIGSLHQLRSHLTVALTNAPCKPSVDDKFVWNGIKNGWGVESDGRFGELVVKLEVPTSNARRTGAVTQGPPSARLGLRSGVTSKHAADRQAREVALSPPSARPPTASSEDSSLLPMGMVSTAPTATGLPHFFPVLGCGQTHSPRSSRSGARSHAVLWEENRT